MRYLLLLNLLKSPLKPLSQMNPNLGKRSLFRHKTKRQMYRHLVYVTGFLEIVFMHHLNQNENINKRCFLNFLKLLSNIKQAEIDNICCKRSLVNAYIIFVWDGCLKFRHIYQLSDASPFFPLLYKTYYCTWHLFGCISLLHNFIFIYYILCQMIVQKIKLILN